MPRIAGRVAVGRQQPFAGRRRRARLIRPALHSIRICRSAPSCFYTPIECARALTPYVPTVRGEKLNKITRRFCAFRVSTYVIRFIYRQNYTLLRVFRHSCFYPVCQLSLSISIFSPHAVPRSLQREWTETREKYFTVPATNSIIICIPNSHSSIITQV